MDYQRYPFDLSAERGDSDKLPNVSQARAGAPDKSLSFRARVTVGDTVTRMVLNFSRTSLSSYSVKGWRLFVVISGTPIQTFNSLDRNEHVPLL